MTAKVSVIRNVQVDASKCTSVDMSTRECEHMDTSVSECVWRCRA